MPSETNAQKNTLWSNVSSVLMTVVVFVVGIYIGASNTRVFAVVQNFLDRSTLSSPESDLSLFWRVWSLTDEKMPGSENVIQEDKINGAIKGMLAAYKDPYTTFFTQEENEIFQGEVSGSFSGIGVEIATRDGYLTVIAPLKGTPAYRAGVETGDIIVKIDDTEMTEDRIYSAVSLIRGEKGTPVVLTIVREGLKEPKEITIIRDTIEIPTLETSVDEKNKIFTIELYNFSEKSGPLFEQAVREFNASSADKLIIDLRNNPGGYLDASIEMASMFIPEGEVIVKEIGKGKRAEITHRSRTRKTVAKKSSIVILVNNGSASASEILAGALQDHNKAILVGEKTFGKGSVQEVINLPGETALKVTVAKWYTPNGISISDTGLTPGYIVKDDESKEGDEQKLKAIELLKK
jgi:carboxyl-terminal processing protease